jgi:hypothetical protein
MSMKSLWIALGKLSPFQLGILLFSIAFLVRLAFIIVFHPYRDLDRYELERTAISLATNGVYGNPYAILTGPSAHVSPGYTLILAALFRIFGTGTPAEVIKELLASGVVALQCALVPAVSTRLNLGRTAGTIAGLIAALYPSSPLVQIDGDWEAPYTALALMLIAVLTTSLWQTRDLSTLKAITHGVCWGVVLLFVSALLPILLVINLVSLYLFRKDIKGYIQFAAVQLLTVGILLAPWTLRNLHALGSPVLTRTNFGLELRVSNNDFAMPDQRTNYLNGVYQRYHPLLSQTEATKVKNVGEVTYNKLALREATDWISQHPARFLALSLGRARCFWLYPDPSPLKALYIAITGILGVCGLLSIVRARPLSFTALAIIFLLYPLPNYLVHVGVRQRYPMDWCLLLLSVVFVMSTRERTKKSLRASEEGVPLPETQAAGAS